MSYRGSRQCPESTHAGLDFVFDGSFLAVASRSQTQARVLKRATHLPTPLGSVLHYTCADQAKEIEFSPFFFNLDRRLLTDIDDAGMHRSRKNALPQFIKISFVGRKSNVPPR